VTEDERILAHIRRHGSITPAQAYEVAGCLALHSAIARLRKAGHSISCTMRSGRGKRWGEYRLTEPQQLSLETMCSTT
jgi:hypothetical protein